MYCIKCGTQLPDGASFCPGCGTRVQQVDTGSEQLLRHGTDSTTPSKDITSATILQRPVSAVPGDVKESQSPVATIGPVPTQSVPVSGQAVAPSVEQSVSAFSMMPELRPFSSIIDRSDVKQELRKHHQSYGFWLVMSLVLPFAGIVLFAMFSDDLEVSEALQYAPFVSLFFFFCALYSYFKERKPDPYQGTVVRKFEKDIEVKRNDDDDVRTETVWIIRVRDAKGHNHDIVTEQNSFADQYLEVGDEIRYLPQFPFPYEKRLRTTDTEVRCMFCGKSNSVAEEKCCHCGAPIIK